MSAREGNIRFTESSSRLACAKRRGARALSTLALAALGLCGCGKAKPVHYFQLTHPPTTALSGSQAAMDATLLVRLFQTSHLYREDRIVYGDDGVQVGLYENERWTMPPVDMLQDALARGLRSSGQFRSVTTLRSDTSVEYYLSGQLYSFRELTGGNVAARLHFDVELMDLKRGKTIWRHTYSHDEPAGKSVGEVVIAMDKNVHMAVQEIQDGMVQALNEYTKK